MLDPDPGQAVVHRPLQPIRGVRLILVAALADRWGYGARCGPGKVVWAELMPG
ncbi:hypothetical protein ACF08M_21830 [Streptomyces sp. NPDC015032]|uniref:hypothetical protein n=1 Tax=Streptomyces sp. NPDC015032 TaxID=3364937 RepID=UPI0036F52067